MNGLAILDLGESFISSRLVEANQNSRYKPKVIKKRINVLASERFFTYDPFEFNFVASSPSESGGLTGISSFIASDAGTIVLCGFSFRSNLL